MVGLGSVTGLGVVSLTLPDLPDAAGPDAAQLGWAVVAGLLAPPVGLAVVRLGRWIQARALPRPLAVTPVVGALVGLTGLLYAGATGRDVREVLFSGQDAIGPLLTSADDFTLGVLALLLTCKAVAYGLSLGAFRGGPVFPATFLGAAGGIALAHLPGLPVLAGAAVGTGAMAVVVLRLPLVSVLLSTLLLGSGIELMPVVVVAVVVAHVLTAWLDRAQEAPARRVGAPG
jgi:hypothetical protein